MTFSIKDFLSKYDQIRRKLCIGHFTEEILYGKLPFCAVKLLTIHSDSWPMIIINPFYATLSL